VPNSPKKTGKPQSFEETARELGCDESEERFEAAFRKIVPPKREGETAQPKRPVRRTKKKPGG
jgi:hypothetical protein